MKRCNCVRYAELLLLKREDCGWIFDDSEGMIRIDSLYPLVDFNYGKPVMICPYFLYIDSGQQIRRAFFRWKDLTDEERAKILLAVKHCKARVKRPEYIINDRQAEILMGYAEMHSLSPVDKTLWDEFNEFLAVRRKYVDFSPCRYITPSERRECIDQVWFEAFDKFRKGVKV